MTNYHFVVVMVLIFLNAYIIIYYTYTLKYYSLVIAIIFRI